MHTNRLWDIYCKVIDNYGDIGLCWRLACELAARQQTVRLWVDDASALEWMAPHGCTGVAVHPWPDTDQAMTSAVGSGMPLCADVVIEAFGCTLPDASLRALARLADTGRPALWVNLEYLSAEPYVERSHGLSSPVQAGPAAGLTKRFFFPGFTPGSGGLLREASLPARQAGFSREAWLAQLGLDTKTQQWISLFCYEPSGLAALLKRLSRTARATTLLVAHGRAQRACRTACGQLGWGSGGDGWLRIVELPPLTQMAYDELLWSCDLNFVRGEDSLVRAIWAGKPFAWQAYPQVDSAHHAKVHALMQRLDMPDDLRALQAWWNGLSADAQGRDAPAQPHQMPELQAHGWTAWAEHTQAALQGNPELVSQLMSWAESWDESGHKTH